MTGLEIYNYSDPEHIHAVTGPDGTPRYANDANGSLTTVQDTVASETLNYSYDVLDRLTGVGGAYSQSYGYNAATGNLDSKAGQTLVYADTDHPHAATGMGSNAYAYDANCNMVSRQISSGTFTLAYDAESRLVGISGGGMSATYTYNGDGKRVKAEITTGSDIKITAYIGDYFEVSVGNPIQQQTPTPPNCSTSLCIYLPLVISSGPQIPAGHAWTSYYYVNGQRVAMRVKSNQDGVEDGIFYFLTDHLGSTAITLDPSGNLVSELRYSAWGETRTSTGVTPTQRRYTGQLEAEAGLYFYNTRWYDPLLSRFVQADSIIPDLINPVDWDRYMYVNGNPIVYNDPNGHDKCTGTKDFLPDCEIINGEWTREWSVGEDDPYYSGDQKTKQAFEGINEVVDFFGSIIVEPYDWYLTGKECILENCNPWMLLGLLPFVPGSIGKTVGHHTIPVQILKLLPPDVADAVRGVKGAPNIWQIPEPLHKIIHSGPARGGYYNAAWRKALEQLLKGNISPQQILEIREQLSKGFGFWNWRP